MADKTWRSSSFKRTIDLSKVSEAETYDLLRFWRVDSGDEKSISIADLISSFVVGGVVPSTRTITINGDTKDLSANRTWTLTTSEISEGTNLYFTQARVRSTPLTGYTVGSNVAIVDTDTILQAFGKVQGQINARPNVTIGTPANGLSVNGSQVVSLGLASAGATGALSSTDWSTFNSKIGGTIASGQVAFGTASNTIGGDSGLTWDNTNKILTNTGNSIFQKNIVVGTSIGGVVSLYVSKNIEGGTSAFSMYSDSIISSAVTGTASYFRTLARTQAASFNNNILSHFSANQSTIGTSSSVTNQYGFEVASSLTGATNNFGFYGNIASGSGRWNLYMNGTANNYLAGQLWIGTTSGTNTLDVNGTARVRTISNLGSAATNVLVPSATGVLSLRTVAELASDIGAVTITGTQTITGAKTFNNALLVQSGSNPVFRIATTDNTATINFRNVSAEDAGRIEYNDPSKILSIQTNVSNADIAITPHGTGKIKLSNVPTGTGDVLGRDASNNLVRLTALSPYKLLDEDITPSGVTSGTYTTLLTGGILGTNSFDGASDTSYEGVVIIRSNSSGSYNFDLRFTIWGQNLDIPVTIGAISGNISHRIEFKLIIQGGEFLLTGIGEFINSGLQYGYYLNKDMTTYTASSTSSIDLQGRISGTGSPTLYMTSFLMKQVK